MRRLAVLTATALAAAALYVGCTQDFDQFEPKGTTFPTSSGTGGAGGGTGGAGGAGGDMATVGSFVASTGGNQCMAPADCGVDTNCTFYSCYMGTCYDTHSADNTAIPPAQQIVGDCKEIRCDGFGGEKTAADPLDLPADEPNDCTTEECNMDMPAHTPIAAGMPCATGICDGMGSCVECLMDGMNTGCMPGDVCDNGMCIGCNDGMQNGNETGIDCGGSCKACDGTPCTMGTDCAGGNCVDTVCCAGACTATCQGCNVPGSAGTCSNLPLYEDDLFPMNVCTGTMTCNGSGACLQKNGEPCNQNSQCASNNCAGGGGNKMCAP